MTEPEVKHFVQLFVNFVQNQIQQRNFSADIVESLEIAQECLNAAFDLPICVPDSQNEDADGNHKMPAFNLFEVFYNSTNDVGIIAIRKSEAERLKNRGNRLMIEKKFEEALVAYNRAITLDVTNAVLYCNRSAAYCELDDYKRALVDCKMSLNYDSDYFKAYGRLGHVYTQLNQHQLALNAYQKAINLDPENMRYHYNLKLSEERVKETNNRAIVESDNRNFGMIEIFNHPTMLRLTRLIARALLQLSAVHPTAFQSMVPLESGRELMSQLYNSNPGLTRTLWEQVTRIVLDELRNTPREGTQPPSLQ